MLITFANPIRFTDLGIGPVALDLGFFQLRWYSLSYLAMIMLGYWLMRRFIQKPGAPMGQQHADDLITYVTLGVILGGRLGYMVIYDHSLFALGRFYKLWEGGMSLHGGLVGVLAALTLYTRKHKLSFLRVCDYIACCVPFGTFLVRLANFANGELWGRPTDVRWGMIFPGAGEVPRHPSQLYEAGLEGLLMAAVLWPLFWKTDARYKPGFLVGIAAIIYGAARFLIEYVREPDTQMQWVPDATGLTTGQWLTLPILIVGIWLALTANARRQRVEPIFGGKSVA
jgi:phosphatidylglycerol---prolipoprotein diacylglyceryl transferase